MVFSSSDRPALQSRGPHHLQQRSPNLGLITSGVLSRRTALPSYPDSGRAKNDSLETRGGDRLFACRDPVTRWLNANIRLRRLRRPLRRCPRRHRFSTADIRSSLCSKRCRPRELKPSLPRAACPCPCHKRPARMLKSVRWPLSRSSGSLAAVPPNPFRPMNIPARFLFARGQAPARPPPAGVTVRGSCC
jgi:hypothetical protein